MSEGEKSLLENAKRLLEDERQLHLAEVKALRERAQTLEHDASAARTESEQATQRASSIIENDSSMRESVERERATFEAERAAWARAESAYRDRVASLERVAAMHNVQESQMGHLRDRAERSETELESLRSRYEQSLRDFDQMLAQARREASETAVARGSVMTELLQTQGENDALRGQVQELLGRLRGVEEEYENLRSGTLAHSAMIGHSPDEEQRNARVYEAFDLSRQTCSAAGARLGMLQGQFRDLADVVGKLAERLTSTAAISITSNGTPRRNSDMEPITVEPAPQAALPDPETIVDDFDDLREELPEEVLAPDIATEPLDEDPYEFEMDEDITPEPEMPAEPPRPAPSPVPPAPQPAPSPVPRRSVPAEKVATPDYDSDEDDDDEPRFFLKPRPAISNDPPAPKPPIRPGEDTEFILS
jgi:hypothetical protein